MRRWILLAFAAVLVPPADAAQHSTSVTVEELQQVLAASEAAHRADADVAQQLYGMELTERLNTAKLMRLKAGLPGEKSQQALVALADPSLFLDPPAEEIPARPRPDSAALRQMLVSVVNYVNTTVRQLPNFIATRDTTRFEDRPEEDIQGEVGMSTFTYVPLHVVGRSNVSVTYRDGHEVVGKDAAKGKKGEAKEQGLFTVGVFGPVLITVVGDALKGKITWSRWEEEANGAEAVFHYAVPREKSHYSVGYCCVSNGMADEGTEPRDWHSFAEVAAYHGEIAFDPTNGAILRITLEADMPPKEVVSKNGMMVEYGAVEIGGKSYICPLRSVSVLLAHTTQSPLGTQPAERYKGPAKTFLNDAVFEQYRRFGSDTRILAGNRGEAADNPPGPAAGDAVSTSPQPAPVASTESAGPAEIPIASAAVGETASAPAPVTAVAPVVPVTGFAPAAPTEPEISRGAADALPDQPAIPAQTPDSNFSLKLTSRLVDVTIVVYDRKGHPVKDLRCRGLRDLR